MPGDDSTFGAAPGFALLDYGAARNQSIAWINSVAEGQLVDTKEKSAGLAEVLDRKAEYRQEDQHRINYYAPMAMRLRVWCIEVKRIETEGKRGEERIIAFVQRTAPMMGKNLADFEIIVQMSFWNLAGA